jgi:hypothetical protein
MLLLPKGEGEFLPYLWRVQFRNRTEQTPGHDIAKFTTATDGEMHHEYRARDETKNLESDKK